MAGGTGNRLAPLTQNDNKHLLPVYNRRMIEYPIKTLVDAGINDIILITGGKRPGVFLEFLKNGKDHGINRLYYTYQEGAGGIADALSLAKPFLGPNEDSVVLLGDNYFDENISYIIKEWKNSPQGAGCILRNTDTPWYFGIAEISNLNIVSIEEKPSNPKSDLAILGCYHFDSNVWKIIDGLTPSKRGELEITDVLKQYMKRNKLTYEYYTGYWSDMGTFETWSEVSQYVANKNQKG